jgi:hypothetical protein
MTRHCLDCGVLVEGDSRCPPHRRARDRKFAAAARARRGNNWTAKSKALRAYWRRIGAGCVDTDDHCRGEIQADHAVPGLEIFVPRCAYHNNKKGNRV